MLGYIYVLLDFSRYCFSQEDAMLIILEALINSYLCLDTLSLYDAESTRVDIKEIVTLWDQVQTDVST